MYSNNILNFQEATIILNANTKKNLEIHYMPIVYIYIYICVYAKMLEQKWWKR